MAQDNTGGTSLWSQIPKMLILISAFVALLLMNLFAWIISTSQVDLKIALGFILAASMIAYFIAITFKVLLSTPKMIMMFLICTLLVALIVIIVLLIYPQAILTGKTLSIPISTLLKGGT